MWPLGMQQVVGAACWGAWPGAASSPQPGSRASRWPSPSCLLWAPPGVREGRKRQRAGESGRGVEGLAQPRPAWLLGGASSSWSPGGGHSAHSPTQRSPRCAHRWLASHPPGIRQQDGSAHFRRCRAQLQEPGQLEQAGVLIVGVALGSLGFLNCRPGSQGAPPEAVVPPLPQLEAPGGPVWTPSPPSFLILQVRGQAETLHS